MNYFENDLKSLHEGLVNKDFSAEELAKETFETIKKREEKIDAFITLDEERAMEKARAVDAKGIDEGNVLDGIPVGIKDNIVTKGLKTTAASKMLENFNPIYNATVMDKLDEKGMITVGKLNMDEFAMGSSTETSAFKKTKNAWDQMKVPGGSRYGLIAFASSMDQIGPLTRSVYDNALMLNAISGHDSRDFTSSSKEVPDFTKGIDEGVKGMRIAVPKEYFAEGVDADVQQAVKDAIKKFEELGATVDEVSLPHTKYGVPVYYIIASSEASSNLQRFDGIRYGFRAEDVKNLEDVYVRSRSEGFGDEVKRRIMLGTFSLSAGTYDAFFKKAAQVRTLICRDYENVFENHDLIFGPTAPTTAYGIGEKIDDPVTMYMNDILTIPVNLAGLPGMSLPAGFSDGLPIGMQLVAPRFREDTLYKAGFAFEQATDFHKAVPEIGGQN